MTVVGVPVDVDRLVRAPAAGQVRGDTPEACVSDRHEHLAPQKRPGRLPVHEQHRVAFALVQMGEAQPVVLAIVSLERKVGETFKQLVRGTHRIGHRRESIPTGGSVTLAGGMFAAIAHFGPVLAAEKSKVPYYIAGGLLVGWALFVSVVLGRRNPSFPSSLGGQRAVMAISAVLVLATISMAVVTSGGSSAKATVAPITHTGREAASGSGTSSLAEEADPEGQLRYTTKNLSAKTGRVTIDFKNMSPLMHNMTIAQGAKVLAATPTFQGGARKLALNLKPGTYVFYCSVPGHRQAGMEGKLTVQ